MGNVNSKCDKITYSLLSKLGSRLNLSFSSQQMLNKKIFGVDGKQRKVLVLEENNGADSSYVIELDKVKCVSIKKVYDRIRPGELKIKRLEEFLKAIYLQFEFGDGRRMITLPFFESEENNIYDLPVLERKTMQWKIMFSKMSNFKSTKIV